jgi:hypothetical protein
MVEDGPSRPTLTLRPARPHSLRASVRRHRRAQDDRSTLRSIRPTRASRPSDASVDPTDARKTQHLRRRNQRPVPHWHSSDQPAIEAGQVHSWWLPQSLDSRRRPTLCADASRPGGSRHSGADAADRGARQFTGLRAKAKPSFPSPMTRGGNRAAAGRTSLEPNTPPSEVYHAPSLPGRLVHGSHRRNAGALFV